MTEPGTETLEIRIDIASSIVETLGKIELIDAAVAGALDGIRALEEAAKEAS